MNCKLIQKGSYRPTLAIGLMLATSVAFQSCQDDTLTGQPSWLGNSIYEELQKDGNYTVTTRLIDDLGLHSQPYFMECQRPCHHHQFPGRAHLY